jgi:hypothetical protein
VARRFLAAVGFDHGLFNMEFFHDPVSDKLTVIEFNPRMASQFSDLYLRVDGVTCTAWRWNWPTGGTRPLLPRAVPGAGAAASFVYRSFDPAARRPCPAGPAPPAGAASFPTPAVHLSQDRRARSRGISNGWAATATASCTWAGATPPIWPPLPAASALLGWRPPCGTPDSAANDQAGPA